MPYAPQQDKSPGLNALSHFRYSKISTKLYEPLYMNLYTVEIELPQSLAAATSSLGSDNVFEERKNLLLEGIKKVGGLDTTKTPAAGTMQKYKSSDRSFADAGPDNTYIDVTMDFDVNLVGPRELQSDGTVNNISGVSMDQVKLLRQWCDLVYDPLTGRMGLKVEYVAPQVVITLHDKAYNPYWMWTLYNVFPTSHLTVPELDYSNKSNIYNVNGFTLRCDMWDETML